MIYKLTVSYKQNGVWKKVSKIFEDEKEMRIKIKAFLENKTVTEQRYWVDKNNGGENVKSAIPRRH